MLASIKIRRVAAGGFTLVELMISMTIVTIILIATAASLQREVESVADLQRLSNAERLVNDFFVKVEERLEFGRGIPVETTLSSGSGAGDTLGLDLTDPFGFPDRGIVVLEPGTANEERIAYESLSPFTSSIDDLERAVRGTSAAMHASGSVVLWEGYAFPIEQQTAPPTGSFDGTTDDVRGQLFYRGDGVGFTYQRPVDPAGTGSYMTTDGIRWGAQIANGDVENACACIVFSPVAEITEADRDFDINADGDLADTFELGRITERSWNSNDPLLGTFQLDLIPALVLQEKDNYGSDLDADGLEDPMFLWTPASGRLRVRLFALIGDLSGRELVRRYETVFYLRNGSAE